MLGNLRIAVCARFMGSEHGLVAVLDAAPMLASAGAGPRLCPQITTPA